MAENRPMRYPRLPREDVIAAAIACGIPEAGMETHNPDGRTYKVALRSPWGWKNDRGDDIRSDPEKLLKAREISDALEARGLICAFDLVNEVTFHVVFELIP